MCALSLIEKYYRKPQSNRILQGDILRDPRFIFEWLAIKESQDIIEYEAIEYQFPYVIILSQDCDLDNDFKNRQSDDPEDHDAYITSILVCPAFPAQDLRAGTHLYELLKFKMEHKNSNAYNYIKTNRDPRYHFLPSYLDYQIPELILDFKHFYALPNRYLYRIYKDHYLASLNDSTFQLSLSIIITFLLHSDK